MFKSLSKSLSKKSSGSHHDWPRRYGLENLGNTCYAAATLQLLFGIKSFHSLFSDVNALQRYLNPNSSYTGLASELVVLFKEMNNCNAAVNPFKFYELCNRFWPSFLNKEHQDPVHFLTSLLEGLKDELSLSNSNPIDDIFGGELYTEIVCLRCEIQRFESI